jgi:hypothetical protein
MVPTFAKLSDFQGRAIAKVKSDFSLAIDSELAYESVFERSGHRFA